MPGVPLSLDLPVAGDTWPTWGTKVVSCLNTIKTDLEAPVVTSEMQMNAALDMRNNGVTNARYFGCQAGNALSIPTNSIGVKDGEWYVTDSAGNSIKLTSGGVINVATSGGITGAGYGAAGVELNWNAGIPVYSFFSATNTYASVRMDDLKLRNGTTAEVSLGWGGSASINQTLPSTNPAAVALVTLDAAGQYAHNATVGTGVTFNNANITLTGTADLKHPTKERQLLMDATPVTVVAGYPTYSLVPAAVKAFQFPLQTGERAIGAKFRFDLTGGTTVFRIYKVVDGVMSVLTLSTGLTSLSVAAVGLQNQTITLLTPYSFNTNETLIVTVQHTVASSTALYVVNGQYDRA